MSIPGGAYPHLFPNHAYGHNPKSILTDRTQQNPTAVESNSLRVTFAKTTAPKTSTSYMASFHNKPTAQTTAKSPATVADEVNKKLQFHSAGEGRDTKTKEASPGPLKVELPKSTTAGAERVRKAFQKYKYKQGAVDVLYPEKMNKPNLMSGSSSGVLVSLKKSDDSVGKKSKQSAQTSSTKSKSHAKKLSRKPTNKSTFSTASRRTKSGKKLKKRKKSKLDEDLEMELTKPAQLSEEYAQELTKITQILKAVTAFDESTSTENGAIAGSTSSGRNNATTFYTYTGSATGGFVTSGSGNKANPRRPLSGNELKQLLSSITRVVSLHQIPVEASAKQNVNEANAVRPGTTFTAPVTKTATPALHSKDAQKKSDDAKIPAAGNLLEAPSLLSTLTTKSKKKKTKTKKFKHPTYIEGSQSEPMHKSRARTSTGSNIKSKSKASLGRKVKPKSKQQAKDSSRPHSDGGSSISSLEKDPVKNAAFLRKYFEESVRLANKKSSEDLLAIGDEATNNTATVPSEEKSKKKKLKKKRSIPKKE